MTQNLKGITLEINGETSPLNKALKGVNQTSRDLQGELYKVEKLLKLDPTNTELLTQKQKLLGDSVAASRDKLDSLKEAQKQATDEFGKTKLSEQQYRELEREIVTTEQKLKGLEAQAKKTNGSLSSDQAISNLKNMGKAVAITAGATVIAIGAIAGAALESADELQRQSDVTGISVERLQELKYAGSKLGVELDTITGAQAKLTKSMLSGKDGTGAQAEAFASLGISVTNSDGSLRDSKVVMEEAFTALGNVGNETERDALTMTIFGKSAMDLNPLIKAGGEELNNLSTEARNNGAVMSGDAVKGLDDFGDGIDSMKQSVTSIVGEALSKLMPYINDLIKGLSELPAWIEQNRTLVDIIAIALGAFVIALVAYNVAAAWGAISTWALATASGALAASIAFLTSPITLTIAAIAALIAVGVLLWRNWDTIGAWGKSIFGGIGTFIGNIFDGIGKGAKSMANGVIDGLNFMIRALNKLKFTVPDWVPLIGGSKFGFDIPQIPSFSVGSRYIQSDTLAQLHEGEMIVPKNENPYANSGGQVTPNMDLDRFAKVIIKGIEKANIRTFISRDDFDNGVDNRILGNQP